MGGEGEGCDGKEVRLSLSAPHAHPFFIGVNQRVNVLSSNRPPPVSLSGQTCLAFGVTYFLHSIEINIVIIQNAVCMV